MEWGKLALGTLCSGIAYDLTSTLGRVEARNWDLITVREAEDRSACMLELTTRPHSPDYIQTLSIYGIANALVT